MGEAAIVSRPVTQGNVRSRRFSFRGNASCGRRGDSNATPGFNGTCLVYEGDEFFMTLNPVRVKQRDKDGKVVRDAAGKPKMVLVERAMPPWADPIAEYPIEVPPVPLRVLGGAAPEAAKPAPPAMPASRQTGPANPNQQPQMRT